MLNHWDWFDQTVNAKWTKTKDSEENDQYFSTKNTKKVDPRKFYLKRVQGLPDYLVKKTSQYWANALFFRKSETNIMLPRLNVQHKHGRKLLTIHEELRIQVQSQIGLCRHKPFFLKQLFERIDTNKLNYCGICVHFEQQTLTRHCETKA